MNKNLVLIGDSLTFGYGVRKNESWAYRLNSNLSYNIINKGINGDTTTSMLDRFYDDVISIKPDLIFIMGGTNDLLTGRSVLSIVENISLMIDDALNNGIDIILGIPPYIIKEMANKLFLPSPYYTYCHDNLPILKNELINLSTRKNIKYLDLYTLTKINVEKNIFTDGIHLNFLGNTIILNEVLRVVNK